MAKNLNKKRPELSTFLIWTFIILMFGSFIGAITVAGIRVHHAKAYTISCGEVIGGNVSVYATYNDKTVLLNDANRRSLAKICASGTIYFKRDSDVLTGKSILFTSKNEDDTIHGTLLVEELSDGKVRATAQNGDNTITASLNDVRFSAFIRLIAENSANGKNEVIK